MLIWFVWFAQIDILRHLDVVLRDSGESSAGETGDEQANLAPLRFPRLAAGHVFDWNRQKDKGRRPLLDFKTTDLQTAKRCVQTSIVTQHEYT
jgi:hypothetical protein